MIAFQPLDLWGWFFGFLTRPIRAGLHRFFPPPRSCVVVDVERAPRGPRPCSPTSSVESCVVGVRWETLGGEAKRSCVHPFLETVPCYVPPVLPVHCTAKKETPPHHCRAVAAGGGHLRVSEVRP